MVLTRSQKKKLEAHETGGPDASPPQKQAKTEHTRAKQAKTFDPRLPSDAVDDIIARSLPTTLDKLLMAISAPDWRLSVFHQSVRNNYLKPLLSVAAHPGEWLQHLENNYHKREPFSIEEAPNGPTVRVCEVCGLIKTVSRIIRIGSITVQAGPNCSARVAKVRHYYTDVDRIVSDCIGRTAEGLHDVMRTLSD